MGDFFYFPDNKLEYIPSVIQFVIFLTITVLVFRLIRIISAREEIKAKQLEEKIRRQTEQGDNH
jgi:flagellar biosynthesis/type III secretory pathway M-ring protein FliF/YscJ